MHQYFKTKKGRCARTRCPRVRRDACMERPLRYLRFGPERKLFPVKLTNLLKLHFGQVLLERKPTAWLDGTQRTCARQWVRLPRRLNRSAERALLPRLMLRPLALANRRGQLLECGVVDDQDAVQVVEFVLKGTRRQL